MYATTFDGSNSAHAVGVHQWPQEQPRHGLGSSRQFSPGAGFTERPVPPSASIAAVHVAGFMTALPKVGTADFAASPICRQTSGTRVNESVLIVVRTTLYIQGLFLEFWPRRTALGRHTEAVCSFKSHTPSPNHHHPDMNSAGPVSGHTTPSGCDDL